MPNLDMIEVILAKRHGVFVFGTVSDKHDTPLLLDLVWFKDYGV